MVETLDAQDLRRQLRAMHKSHQELSAEAAEEHFIMKVQSLQDYGFHFHKLLWDKKNPTSDVLLGISPHGIAISNKPAFGGIDKLPFQHYSWQNILQISFVKQHFFVTVEYGTLRRHPRKYRFFSEENLGKYVFNLARSHHRLHLRLHFQSPEHGEDLSKCANTEPCTAIETDDKRCCDPNRNYIEKKRDTETNSNKPKKNVSVTCSSLSSSSSPVLSSKSKKKVLVSQKKKTQKKDNVFSTIFKNEYDVVDDNDGSIPTQPEVAENNETPLSAMPSCFVDLNEKSLSANPLEDPEATIDLSLVERFANMTGIEKLTERKVARVALKKDEDNNLGITVFEGVDGATYIQSIQSRNVALNLKPGDRIMAVNGKDVQTLYYKEVVDVLRQTSGTVHLMLSQAVHSDQLTLAVNTQKDTNKPFLPAFSHLPLNFLPVTQRDVIKQRQCSTLCINSVNVNHNNDHESLHHQQISHLQPNISICETSSSLMKDHDHIQEPKTSSSKFQMDSFSSEVFALQSNRHQLSGDGKLTAFLNQYKTMGNPAVNSDVPEAIEKSIKPSKNSGPPFISRVVLEKIQGGLGLRLVSNNTQLSDEHQEHVVVESLTPNGAAAFDGRIRPGDAIVEVEGENVSGLSHYEVIGRLRAAPQLVHLAIGKSTPTKHRYSESSNNGDGGRFPICQSNDRYVRDPACVQNGSPKKTCCTVDGSKEEYSCQSVVDLASIHNKIKTPQLTESYFENSAIMVSKLNQTPAKETGALSSSLSCDIARQNTGAPGDPGNSSDMVQGSASRAVLWEPKVSGSVKNRISNFEAHLKSTRGWQSPILLARKPLSQSNQELGQEKDVKKLGNLQKFPSLPESQGTDVLKNIVDTAETSANGQWCSAIVSKPYRPRFAPRLMRSQTLPTVCHGPSVLADSTVSSGSPSPGTPETPPPWFAELRSRKLQQRPPWWSRANSVDENAGAGVIPKSPDSSRRKTFASYGLSAETQFTPNCDNVPVLLQRPNGNVSLRHSPVTQISPLQNSSPRPVSSFETKIHATDKLTNKSTPHNNGFSKVSAQLTRAATVYQLTRSFEKPCQVDVTKNIGHLSHFHQDSKLDELHKQFHFINKDSIFDVSLTKNSRGLGISICGGIDQDSEDPLSIFIRVKKLYPLQPALESGKLEVGDIILKVNGRHLTNLKHSKAVDVLRISPVNVVLLICRPPSGIFPAVPQNDGALVNTSVLSLSSLNLLGVGNNVVPQSQKFPKETIVVLEKINGSLGFTIHKKDDHHQGHYIKALVKEPALTDGRLQPGDEILKVNGIDISCMARDEAINALRSSVKQVTLTVRRSDDQTMSPLSPLSPTSPLSHEIANGRQDKKMLRKEAQDLLSDTLRKRNGGNVSGPCDPAKGRLHRHKGRSSPSAVSVDSASDIAESLSSTSDAGSRLATPTLARKNLGIPEVNKQDSWSQQSDLSRESSMNSLFNGISEMAVKISRPVSLDLNQGNIKKGEQLAQALVSVSNSGLSRVPSLCVSKWESDYSASADDTDTDSSGNVRKPQMLDEPKNVAQSSLVAPSLCHSMSDGNFASESCKSLAQQPWHSSADGNFMGLKKWRGTELPFPANFEPQSKLVVGENMTQDAFTVELDRHWNSRLGFNLISVEIGKLKGSFIRAIHPDSLASRDGRLQPGDQILEVNGTIITGMHTDDVIEMLRKLKGKVLLTVSRNLAITNSVLTLIHLQSTS